MFVSLETSLTDLTANIRVTFLTGSNVTNIATVIGPSPNGSPVVLPPSLLTPQSSSKKRSETGVIVGIVVALVVAAILVCVAFGIHCYCRNRKRHELPLLTWDSRDLSKESWESRIASALGELDSVILRTVFFGTVTRKPNKRRLKWCRASKEFE